MITEMIKLFSENIFFITHLYAWWTYYFQYMWPKYKLRCFLWDQSHRHFCQWLRVNALMAYNFLLFTYHHSSEPANIRSYHFQHTCFMIDNTLHDHYILHFYFNSCSVFRGGWRRWRNSGYDQRTVRYANSTDRSRGRRWHHLHGELNEFFCKELLIIALYESSDTSGKILTV